MLLIAVPLQTSPTPWVVYEGHRGPGKGKSIVFLTGDEEYRSEEGLPQLAKILASRQGFNCTVLFSINARGEIDPNTKDNEPGLEALDTADLCVMLLRFRKWPDAQMSHFENYYRAGKPIIALRTSTHAFDYPEGSTSAYANESWQNKTWTGGFGRQVLGETWVSHWGDHGRQATRGVFAPNPILQGVKEIFGTTDVYEATPLPDAKILVRGEVLTGLNPTDPPATNRKKTAAGVEQEVNLPMMPIVWTRTLGDQKILTTTMGAATDLLDEGLRRLLVNAVFWSLNLEKQIRPNLNVNLIAPYHPSPFAFNGFRKGVKPQDLAEKP
jgi:hypothetical protein